jgi:hypothetical protein
MKLLMSSLVVALGVGGVMGCGDSASSGNQCFTTSGLSSGSPTAYERACANLPALCRDGLGTYGSCSDPAVTTASTCAGLLVLAAGLGGEGGARNVGCLAQNTTRAGYNACLSACGVSATDGGSRADATVDAGPAAPSLAGTWRRTAAFGPTISTVQTLNITGDGLSGNPPVTHTWVATNSDTACVTTTTWNGTLLRNSATAFTFSPTGGARVTASCRDASENRASAALTNDELLVGSFANQAFTVTATELRLEGSDGAYTRQ